MGMFDFLNFNEGSFGQTQAALKPGGIEAYNALPWYKNANLMSSILGQGAQAVTASDPTSIPYNVGKTVSGLAKGNIGAIQNKQAGDERKAITALLLKALSGGITPKTEAGLSSFNVDDSGMTIKYTPDDMAAGSFDRAGEVKPNYGTALAPGFGEGVNDVTGPFVPGSSGSVSPNLMGLSFEDILGLQQLQIGQDTKSNEALISATQNEMLRPVYAAHAGAYEAQAAKDRAASTPAMQYLTILEKMALIEERMGSAAKSNSEHLRLAAQLPYEKQKMLADIGATEMLARERKFTGDIRKQEADSLLGSANAQEVRDKYMLHRAQTDKILSELNNLEGTPQHMAAANAREHALTELQKDIGENKYGPEASLNFAYSWNRLANRPYMYIADPKSGWFGASWGLKLINLPMVNTSRGPVQATSEMIYRDIANSGRTIQEVLTAYGIALPQNSIINPGMQPPKPVAKHKPEDVPFNFAIR